MPIPDSWIDKIFDKLTMVYGHQFIGRWSGLDLVKVKADWAHELDGLQARPQAIGYALQNLPTDHPPTVLQFREICRRTPEVAEVLALDAPKPDPERVAAAVSGIRQSMTPVGDHLSRQRQHMQMEIAGERLSVRQREFWRIALRSEILTKYRIDTAEPFSLDDLGQAINGRRAA